MKVIKLKVKKKGKKPTTDIGTAPIELDEVVYDKEGNKRPFYSESGAIEYDKNSAKKGKPIFSSLFKKK